MTLKPSDLKGAQTLLEAATRAAITPGFEADNPILHARGKLELQRNASPEVKVLSDEVAQLRQDIAALAQRNTAFRPQLSLADLEKAGEFGKSFRGLLADKYQDKYQHRANLPRGLLDELGALERMRDPSDPNK
jgi:hypothetical protein